MKFVAVATYIDDRWLALQANLQMVLLYIKDHKSRFCSLRNRNCDVNLWQLLSP